MKTLIILFFVGFSYAPPNNGNATVSKIQGVSIYIYSQPTEAYQVIDSGKILVTVTGSCNDSINSAAKKAAKAGADAVIFYPQGDRWEAIEFN